MERAADAPREMVKGRRLGNPLAPVNTGVLWLLLTLVVAGAYGLLFYLNQAREAERAVLQAQVAAAQQQLRALQAGLADAEAVRQRLAQAQAERAHLVSRLAGSAEHVAVMEGLAALAERVGVTYTTLSLGGTAQVELEEQRYVVRQPSIMVVGERERVIEFVEALQSGMLPGMTVKQLSVQRNSEQMGATLMLNLYTWPSQEQTFTLPPTLEPVGPVATAMAQGLPVGALDAPVLAWEVRGLGEWTDHLRQATFGYAVPQGSVTSFALYVESSGDELLNPFQDTLLARAAPGPNGETRFEMEEPYAFAAPEGARFYLAAEVSPDALPFGELEVLVAPGAIVYTSTWWPRAGETEDFHVRLPLRVTPLATGISTVVQAGTSVDIVLRSSGTTGEVSFRIVETPRHGLLLGDPPVLTYVADPGYEGEDTFTYVATDGLVFSAPAVVRVRVWQPGTPPSAEDLVVQIRRGGPTPITLMGSETEREPLRYIIVERPKYGRLEGYGAQWTYTPYGPLLHDRFTYKVSDSRGESLEAEVELVAP